MAEILTKKYAYADRWYQKTPGKNCNVALPMPSKFLVQSGNTRVAKNAVQRRVKPANLLAHQTALADQYISVVQNIVTKEMLNEHPSPPCYRTRVTISAIWGQEVGYMNPPAAGMWQTDMRNKINDTYVNLADTIGEYRESCHVVAGGVDILLKAKRIARQLWKNKGTRRKYRRLVAEVLHRDTRTPKENFNDLVGGYLAVQFGVVPYANTAVALQEAYLKRATQKGIYRRIVVSKTTSASNTTAGKYGGSATQRCETSVRATVYVKYAVPTGAPVSSGNLASALWAGTRLSFMVDYFFGVANFLKAFDNLEGVISTYGTLSTRYKWFVEDRRLQYNTFSTVVSAGRQRKTLYKRSVLTSIPLPRKIERKDLSRSASWGKLTSASAILYSLIQKRR